MFQLHVLPAETRYMPKEFPLGLLPTFTSLFFICFGFLTNKLFFHDTSNSGKLADSSVKYLQTIFLVE